MFEFLKDLFGVPRPVTVIGYEEPEVIVTSETPLDLGVVDVLATIEGVEIKGQIKIVESGLESCRGLWLAPEQALPLLVEVFTPEDKRQAPRYSRKLRVRSTRLEGFQGNSLDISESGMRLVGKGDLKLGEVIPLTFDLDDSRETQISVQARVCWMAPAAEKDWLAVGVEYQDLNEHSQSHDFDLYQEFLNQLEE